MRTLYKKGQFDIPGAGVVSYVIEFTVNDLVAHILSFRHEIFNSSSYPVVIVYNASGTIVSPNSIRVVDEDTIVIDLTALDTPITGTWHVRVVGN